MKKIITTALATMMLFATSSSAFASTYDVMYDRTSTGTLEYIYSIDGFIQLLSTPNPDGVVSAEIVAEDPNSYAFIEDPNAEVYSPIKMVTIEVETGVTIDLSGKSNFEIGLMIEDEQGNYYDDASWASVAMPSGDLEAYWDSDSDAYLALMEVENPYDETIYGSYEAYKDRMLTNGVLSGELGFVDGSFLKVNTPGVYRVHVQINDMTLGQMKDSIMMLVVDGNEIASDEFEETELVEVEAEVEAELVEVEVEVETEIVEVEEAEIVEVEVEIEIAPVIVEEIVVVETEILEMPEMPVVEEIVIAPAPTQTNTATATIANPRTLEAGDAVYVTGTYETLGKIALNNYGTYGVHQQLAAVNTALLNSTNWQMKEGMAFHLPESIGSHTRLNSLNTAEGKVHTVQAGETLSKIAALYYGDTQKATTIFEGNSDRIKSINMIYEGQQIIIPGIY